MNSGVLLKRIKYGYMPLGSATGGQWSGLYIVANLEDFIGVIGNFVEHEEMQVFQVSGVSVKQGTGNVL